MGLRIVDLLLALRVTQLGLVSFARSAVQRQGLLHLILTVYLQNHGPHPPTPGPRASDNGPLVLAL